MAAPLLTCTCVLLSFLFVFVLFILLIFQRRGYTYRSAATNEGPVCWGMPINPARIESEDCSRPDQTHGVVTRVDCGCSTHLEISQGSVPRTTSSRICYSITVSGRWVPRQQLTPELKERCIDTCKELFQRFAVECDGWFAMKNCYWRETWVHHHVGETKRTNIDWAIPPRGNRRRFHLLTFCWDEGVVVL